MTVHTFSLRTVELLLLRRLLKDERDGLLSTLENDLQWYSEREALDLKDDYALAAALYRKLDGEES